MSRLIIKINLKTNLSGCATSGCLAYALPFCRYWIFIYNICTYHTYVWLLLIFSLGYIYCILYIISSYDGNVMQAANAAQLRLTPPYFNIAENRYISSSHCGGLKKVISNHNNRKHHTTLLQHCRKQVLSYFHFVSISKEFMLGLSFHYSAVPGDQTLFVSDQLLQMQLVEMESSTRNTTAGWYKIQVFWNHWHGILIKCVEMYIFFFLGASR